MIELNGMQSYTWHLMKTNGASSFFPFDIKNRAFTVRENFFVLVFDIADARPSVRNQWCVVFVNGQFGWIRNDLLEQVQ